MRLKLVIISYVCKRHIKSPFSLSNTRLSEDNEKFIMEICIGKREKEMKVQEKEIL